MPERCNPPATGREVVAMWKKLMAFTPDLYERAALLSIIAQPTRLRLFYVLDQLGEVCVCDLAEILGVTQSSVSQHLARFKVHGLVIARRDAQTLYYRLSDRPDVKALRELGLAGIAAAAP
jgi:ArsR family transcriptional regulator